ncbi:MAG TPA: hypothetical protein VGC79_18425 [Polyangiaceae bacterium]
MRLNRLAGTALLLASCGSPPPATPAAALRPPPPLRVIAQHEPLRGYRLSQSFVAKGPFRDGAPLRVGAIVNGLRVRPDASGLRFAESESLPALQAGVPLPEAWGGGFLFWNESALYTADSFLGTLVPLFEIGFRPARVSFGPNFALLRGTDGQRLAIDLRTRQRVTLAPPLLADIALGPSGRALALLEGGACQLSVDGGKSYQPVALPAGAHALSVREASGQLFAALTSDQQLRIDPAGEVQFEGAARTTSARPANSLWPLAELPLERALAFGVPIGEGFAGVAVAGSVATVNLRTGELVQVTRALVPSELSCRTLDVNSALLLACNSRENGSVVLSDTFGERPQTQAKFESGVRLDFADGVLVAAARCDGQVLPGAVCVRSVDGRFHDFDVSAQLAKLEHATPQTKPHAPAPPPAPPKPGAEPARAAPLVVRWVPKVGGGAVAVIGGSAPGLLDAQTGHFVAILPEVLDLARPDSRSAEDWLGLDWIALADGSVRGWLSNGAVSIAADGRLEPSVYEFARLSGAGAHALAFDRGQRVFQSSDWGRSWVETLAPPHSASGGKQTFAPRCSQVGCLLGPWLRVGWEAEVPAARLRRSEVAAAPPAVPREALPTLNCKQLAAAVVAEQPEAAADSPTRLLLGMSQGSLARDQDYDGTFSWATVHPLNGAGYPLGLRASFAIRAPGEADPDPLPANWPGYSAQARISFVSAFEPLGRIQSASVSWRALSDAARATGAELPSFQSEQVDGLASLPVLGLSAGESAGLILEDDLPIWVRGSGAAVALGTVGAESSWISAVQSAPDKLALLGGHADGSVDVVEFAAGRARRLFQMPALDAALYPGNADALAIGARGALAILRTPSGSEPASSSDPALLFHEDGSVTALAPWSRLFAADAPECKPAASDFRVLLQTSRAWLRLVDAAEPMTNEALQAGMFAILRGNAERLCLEAVELADAPVQRTDATHETHLAARFVGRGRGAARLGFASGFEFRQALSCSLASAR